MYQQDRDKRTYENIFPEGLQEAVKRFNDILIFCQECREGFYGANCNKACSCPKEASCDHVTGNCSCPAGLFGKECNSSKELSFFILSEI